MSPRENVNGRFSCLTFFSEDFIQLFKQIAPKFINTVRFSTITASFLHPNQVDIATMAQLMSVGRACTAYLLQ